MKNSAGKRGDILYGGAVALGLDGDWNCFKNISNISQNGLSLISSDAPRVCLCNGTEQPDSHTTSDSKMRFVYPGTVCVPSLHLEHCKAYHCTSEVQ